MPKSYLTELDLEPEESLAVLDAADRGKGAAAG
mgnify:CR=1 FL=1